MRRYNAMADRDAPARASYRSPLAPLRDLDLVCTVQHCRPTEPGIPEIGILSVFLQEISTSTAVPLGLARVLLVL